MDADSSPDGPAWLTYVQLGERLGVSAAAARARAIRGLWRRQLGNDGFARVLFTPEIAAEARTHAAQPVNDCSTAVRTAAESVPVQASDSLVNSLQAHIGTLKTQNETFAAEVERLRGELAGEKEQGREKLTAAEARADKAMAELATEKARAEQAVSELAGERAARHAEARLADMREADVAILRKDQAAQLAQRDEQLAAARAAADKATAELVTLAQRLAAVAESQKADAAKAVPEPPRRSRLARGWAWFLRN
jgi:hypothetical protein